MEVRHNVRRFPASAFALILALVAAVAVLMTLSIGGWGMTFTGPSSSANPTGVTTTQPAIPLQQPPDAQDRTQQYGQQPVSTPQLCAGSPSDCAS